MNGRLVTFQQGYDRTSIRASQRKTEYRGVEWECVNKAKNDFSDFIWIITPCIQKRGVDKNCTSQAAEEICLTPHFLPLLRQLRPNVANNGAQLHVILFIMSEYGDSVCLIRGQKPYERSCSMRSLISSSNLARAL